MNKKKNNIFRFIPIIIVSFFMLRNVLTTKNVEIDVLEKAINEQQVQEITISKSKTTFKVDDEKMKTEAIEDNSMMTKLLDSKANINKEYQSDGPPLLIIFLGFGILSFIFIMLRKINNLKIYRNFGLVHDDFFMEKSDETPDLNNKIIKELEPILSSNKITPNKILLSSKEDNLDIAKFLSSKLDISYLNINIVDVYNMFRMLGAYRVEKLFEFAKNHKPNIIYFDTELKDDFKESIKKRRLHTDNSVDVEFPDTEQRLILIQLLEEIKNLDDDVILILNIDRNNKILKDLIDENDFNLTLNI